MTETELKQLTKNIRNARKSKGLTQLEVARLLGKDSAAWLALIESGKRNISLCDYVRLRQLLGFNLNFLHDFN